MQLFKKWWIWLIVIIIVILILILIYPKYLPEILCSCWDGLKNECLSQSACI